MKQIIFDFTKPNQTIEITEDTEILGLYIGKGSDVIQDKFTVVHKLPHLKSLTTIKAVVYDQVKFDLEGKLVIEKGAYLTDAYLRIDVLIMSKEAMAKAVPSLEITENNVKGGHGATIGQVDKEQLFYLESRGLDHQQAEEVLVQGFIAELVERIQNQKSKIKN